MYKRCYAIHVITLLENFRESIIPFRNVKISSLELEKALRDAWNCLLVWYSSTESLLTTSNRIRVVLKLPNTLRRNYENNYIETSCYTTPHTAYTPRALRGSAVLVKLHNIGHGTPHRPRTHELEYRSCQLPYLIQAILHVIHPTHTLRSRGGVFIILHTRCSQPLSR